MGGQQRIKQNRREERAQELKEQQNKEPEKSYLQKGIDSVNSYKNYVNKEKIASLIIWGGGLGFNAAMNYLTPFVKDTQELTGTAASSFSLPGGLDTMLPSMISNYIKGTIVNKAVGFNADEATGDYTGTTEFQNNNKIIGQVLASKIALPVADFIVNAPSNFVKNVTNPVNFVKSALNIQSSKTNSETTLEKFKLYKNAFDKNKETYNENLSTDDSETNNNSPKLG